MESNLSSLSLNQEDNPVYVQPHYKESYRLAIYALLRGGKEAYEEFLRAEKIRHFLSEEEILYILENAELPVVEDDSTESPQVPDKINPSTYFPTESDEEVPDLDLGWPEVTLEAVDTSISMLFHPPRQNTPTIKEVIRKQIQEARQIIAIAMDVFTDVDIFKEIINASLRGVVVYILLDDSQFKSFHSMSCRMGVNIKDYKTIRVRTVRGQQYQCQSGMKFYGSLEQKFIMLDCRTVLYGTYSYTWSYEKIRLSMVLVITGQLTCSYDEEFRRLYACSIVPGLLSTSGQGLRDNAGLHSSSYLSLQHVHLRSRGMPGMRCAQDDRLNNGNMLNRGLSMQERLNQSHYAEMGNLVRGNSYGEELQRLNSRSRQRMGTKDVGPPERTGSNMMIPNSFSQQHLRHQNLYGVDQNLIPYCSEKSLNKWKIDTYLNDSDTPLDALSDVMSPLTSPYSSHMGLNEHQSQLIHSRSRDIKARLEEIRQSRLSLQECTNHKQSQESLRAMYPTIERPKLKSTLRGQDIGQSIAEPYAQDSCRLEPANHKDSKPKMEAHLHDGQRSASHFDIKTVVDRKTVPVYDWHEPLSRTTSATELDMKLNEPSLKHSQPPKVMESLIEIPEEKEGSNTHVNVVNSVKSSIPPESQHQDVCKQSEASISCSSGSTTQKEDNKSISNETKTGPRVFNLSAESQRVADSNGQTEKQQEEQKLQRKNSVRSKVCSLLMSDEKKASKKEEKSLHRRASLRSPNPSGPNQSLRANNSLTPSAEEQTTKNVQSPIISRAQNSFSFNRLSPLRSSKKKTNPAEEQDQGLRSTLNDEAPPVYPTRREKAYSRFEYLLSTDNLSADKSLRTASMRLSDKDRSCPSLNRNDAGYSMYQTQSSTDKKLGRFMQRVGNLIGKNK